MIALRARKVRWYHKYIIYPILGSEVLSGSWKIHPDDRRGEERLDRHEIFLDAVRGPGVVRVKATYEINPLTQRIDRGYYEETLVEPDVFGFRFGHLRPFTRHFMNLKMCLFALFLGSFNVAQTRTQAGLLLFLCSINIFWLVVIRPFEDPQEGFLELTTLIFELITFSISSTIAITTLSMGSMKEGEPDKIVRLNTAMAAVQGAGFFFFLTVSVISSTFLIVRIIKEYRERKIKAADRARDQVALAIHEKEFAEYLISKKFANRWMNKVLKRSVDGWPRLGPYSAEDRAIISKAVTAFIVEPKQQAWALKMVKDDVLGPLSSMILHSLPDDFDRDLFLKRVREEQKDLLEQIKGTSAKLKNRVLAIGPTDPNRKGNGADEGGEDIDDLACLYGKKPKPKPYLDVIDEQKRKRRESQPDRPSKDGERRSTMEGERRPTKEGSSRRNTQEWARDGNGGDEEMANLRETRRATRDFSVRGSKEGEENPSRRGTFEARARRPTRDSSGDYRGLLKAGDSQRRRARDSDPELLSPDGVKVTLDHPRPKTLQQLEKEEMFAQLQVMHGVKSPGPSAYAPAIPLGIPLATYPSMPLLSALSPQISAPDMAAVSPGDK